MSEFSEFFDLEKRRAILGLGPNRPWSAVTPQTEREEALKQAIFCLEFDNEALTLETHPHFDWNQESIEKTRTLLLLAMEKTEGSDIDIHVCSAFLECYSMLGAFSAALRDNDALRVVLQDFLSERGHAAQARAYLSQTSPVG